MSPEAKKDLLEKQETQKKNPDIKLNTEIEKKDNSLADGMDLMAKAEISTIKSDFSADELNNPVYNSKFTKAQENLTAETQKILTEKGTPEEKTKAMEFAFEKFQAEVRSIEGTKEAQDAQRSTKQAENIKKNEKKNEQLSQKFKEDLLQKSQESVEKKLQAQKLAAEKLGNKEQEVSQEEAKESIQSTSAFGPPGNLEKGNSKV